MGKGTKKKTVWRTFSFENGYTNGTDADTTNGITAPQQKNGAENGHDVSNRSSISNGKFMGSWRSQRYTDDMVNENEPHSKLHDANGNVNGYTDNDQRSYFKRAPLTDKYPLRCNGLRKAPSYFQENGNKSDFHDIYENSMKQHQFRSNRSAKVPPASRHANYKKWDSRNGNYTSGILSNYSRGFRKSHYSDQAAAAAAEETTRTTGVAGAVPISNEIIMAEDFHENGLTKNARNADDSDKCQDNVNGNSSSQLSHDQTDQHRGLQQNKFNEDEYTRISTPRSEVLFKKGYLMRDKKYVGPANMISTTATSSNDSGSVSVVSNEETASYYSIQSMSPDNSTYMNGNNSSDSTSATYPNDGFEHDLSLIYSSGFYDNNGYFYVNPYIHNSFDQFNGPTILMPYGSATTTKDIDAYDADVYPQAPMSPVTGDGKSIDDEHGNNYNSINSEEMSNSSLSENISINNDPDTPPNPLTPPPSPLSPNEKPIAPSKTASEIEKPSNESDESDQDATETDAQTENARDKPSQTNDPVNDELNEEVLDADAIVSDNYSMPYFSPFIFVPPIPFVPDGRLAGSKRGKFRRHLNQFGRPKRNNRFSNFYNKVYIPSNWSEAPDETALNETNDDEAVQTKSGDEKPVDAAPAPTIEQCDTILKKSKLNLNVSEFIPQSKRMIFVPLPITPSPPASVYFVPIPSTESTLNVNVPEFLPKNYKPLNVSNDQGNDEIPSSVEPSSTTTITVNGDDTTFVTNESVENQNETTNKHINGLTNDDKCTKNVLNTDTPNTNDFVSQIKCHETANEHETHTINKQNGVTATTMSNLLKTNSNSLNLDACSFNKENIHTNLKADLGSKKITNNISKSKIYKMDNYCNDSGSNKSHKINNNNKNAKTRHAYPKIKETSQQSNAWGNVSSSKIVERTDANGHLTAEPSPNLDINVMDKSIEKPGLTYAQMVVPAKVTAKVTPNIVNITPESTEAEAKTTKGTVKLSKTSAKGKMNGNVNRKVMPIKKKITTDNRTDVPEKPIESAVEWFTIGAKGKKHITPNGNTVTQIAFDDESKEEKVNKIAQELQLDINKDADLAMDILDSLTITDDKREDKTVTKAPKKKKTPTNASKSKKKPKDKSTKEPKRRDTFDIIEPNFVAKTSDELTVQDDENNVNDENQHSERNIDIESPKEDDSNKSVVSTESNESMDELIFDPSVFATPCNLQMETTGKLGNPLRLSTGKTVRNIINQFDIYQQDYTSIENQQLKQEEEMVIKILQQLNKSRDVKDEMQTNKDVTVGDIEQPNQVDDEFEAIEEVSPAKENSIERFAINAKPYQNVYASNHFLEHFFGDRNDKCDHVEPSTDLSSSDQSHVEEAIEHFNTYPAIDDTDEYFFKNQTTASNQTDVEIKQTIENEIEQTIYVQCEQVPKVEDDYKQQFEDELAQKTEIEANECEVNVADDTQQMVVNEAEEVSKIEIVHVQIEQIEQIAPEIDEMADCVIAEIPETQPELRCDEKSAHKLETAIENESENGTKTESFEIAVIEAPGDALNVSKESSDSPSVLLSEACDTKHMEKPKMDIQIEIQSASDEINEQKPDLILEIETEPMSIGTETSSIEIEPVSSISCNQSVKSNSSNGRPWLRIVDTQMLQHEKKLQQTFPITSAVSMWLQAQKEKTPEPVLRIPDYRFFSATGKRVKIDSQTSHSNSSIDLTEDTASITSDKFHINDDEEEDIMNFWESPSMLTPQSPTPPPIYNSVYGSSINYTNLLSNKNELLCNNIVEYDRIDTVNGKMSEKPCEKPILNLNKNGFNQNADGAPTKSNADEKCYRPPPEVCCTIM